MEEYVKDLYADTFDMNETDRLEVFNNVFSYLGNNSNPPDLMILGGDAIEVKKIESSNAALALNSSYPKQKLFANSPMINTACRNAEQWSEKDITYIVGVVSGNSLKHLCFVYGLDYSACDEVYSKIKNTIKTGVEGISGVEFSDTKELGKVKKVDPLGITYLRVRGMWGIDNPWSVFNYAYSRDENKEFNFMCIINEEKWNKLSNTNELMELSTVDNGLYIKDIRIKNPDNPAQLRNAKLIKFTK